MTSQDATRRFGGDGEEDEEMPGEDDYQEGDDNDDMDFDDDSEILGSERAGSNQKQVKKGERKDLSASNGRKKDLRIRKNIDYNEERIELGKRPASGWVDEGLQR